MLDLPSATEPGVDDAERPPSKPPWWRSLQSDGTRRALLLTALGGLLIAGLVTALPRGADGSSPLTATAKVLGLRGSATFNQLKAGDCMNWPDRTPDAAPIVPCTDEHRFEVADAIDMSTFPGSEYGPDAAPPSKDRIQQITQEQCQAAARQYLGQKFDPNSRFTVSLLWSGEKAWRDSGERRVLCGLQLPGPNNQQLAFKGRVADSDQSKVWSPGTCLGIDPATNQPTDIPVDCSAPHAMEVTGSVNLGQRFPGALPPDAEQDGFVKDECTKITDAYLAPIQLRSTTLTLIYSTISLPSWSAGSRQVSCSIGATLGNGGWSTLLNGAKGPLQINGQPVVAPPDIPEERLNLPPIPMPTGQTSQSEIDMSDQSGSNSGSGSGSSSDQSIPADDRQGNNHLPGQPGPQTDATTAPPVQGNTFLNGPPAPPAPPADPNAPPVAPPPGDAGAVPPPPGAPVPPPAEIIPPPPGAPLPPP